MRYSFLAISLLFCCISGINAAAIFTIDLNPPLLGGVPDPQGLSYATSVLDNTPPVHGNASDILGLPDNPGGITNFIVDFNGSVTVGFDVDIRNGAGVDAKVFATQLDPTEGFDLFISANGTDFSLVGTFPGSTSQVNVSTPLTINIDFNDAILPNGARFLRFVNETPISSATFGTDFDAVGVVINEATVPEASSLVSLLLALCLFPTLRKRVS